MAQSKVLNALIGTTSKVEILRVLFERGKPMTGRRIAATAAISPRSCQLSLDILVKINALTRKPAGRAYSYTINESHRVVSTYLRPLFETERQFAKDAAQVILKFTRPVAPEIAAIFWGIARVKKDETLRYVVVVKGKKTVVTPEIVTKITEAIAAQWGFPVKIDVVTTQEFAGSYLPTAEARNQFAASFDKLKGASFQELTGTTPAKRKRQAAV